MCADGFPLKNSMSLENLTLEIWREGFLRPNLIFSEFWASRFRGVRSEYTYIYILLQMHGDYEAQIQNLSNTFECQIEALRDKCNECARMNDRTVQNF